MAKMANLLRYGFFYYNLKNVKASFLLLATQSGVSFQSPLTFNINCYNIIVIISVASRIDKMPNGCKGCAKHSQKFFS